MEVTEIRDGIKRLYLDDFDFTVLKGSPGELKAPLLRVYLNNEENLGVKEILDIVMCEERFSWYVYHK